MTDESKKKDTLFDQCQREMFRQGFLFPHGGFPETIKFLCDRIEKLENAVKKLNMVLSDYGYDVSPIETKTNCAPPTHGEPK